MMVPEIYKELQYLIDRLRVASPQGLVHDGGADVRTALLQAQAHLDAAAQILAQVGKA